MPSRWFLFRPSFAPTPDKSKTCVMAGLPETASSVPSIARLFDFCTISLAMGTIENPTVANMVCMENLLQLIENHGFAIVALVALVFWLRPKIDDMWTLLLGLAQKPADAPLSTRLHKSMDLNDKIMAILRAVLPEFKASRVYIFSYHNGGKNVLGIDFARVSCTHEVVALGTPPQQAWLQNLPVTLVWAFSRLINSGVGVVCPCIEDCFMETDSSTYEALRAQGIKSCYCVGLYSDARIPIGFLGLDYCEQRTSLSEDQVERLKIFAERIATLFCVAGHEMCVMGEV